MEVPILRKYGLDLAIEMGAFPVLERTEGEGRSAPPGASSVQCLDSAVIQNVVLTLHVTALLVCRVAL